MEFYWDEVEDNTYALYMRECAYPLGSLVWCDECQCYHFNSEFFNFEEDYEEDDFIDDEEELLELVRLDLIYDLSDKIKFMTEELSGLGRM